MKKSFVFLLACISLSSFADRGIDSKISRLQTAASLGDFDRLSPNEREIVNSGLDRALSVLRMDDRRPMPGPGPGPGPMPQGPQRPHGGDWRRNMSFDRNKVIAYTDDRCMNQLTELRPKDDCSRLGGIFGRSNVWSIQINDKCINIPDTSFGASCQNLVDLSGGQKPRASDLVVYTDDRCMNELTVIDAGVDCLSLGNVLSDSNVWSVKFFGQCVNIPDTKFSVNKCDGFQNGVLSAYDDMGGRRRGDEVQLFSDDRCVNSVTTITRGNDCGALDEIFTGQNIWSVRFRGQCVNIEDTTFRPACESYSR